MAPYDQRCSFLDNVLVLLENDKRSLIDIHKQTGLPFYWLRKIKTGEIKNPSVNRIVYLYQHLTDKNTIEL